MVENLIKLLSDFFKILFLTLQMLPINYLFLPKVLTLVQYKH